MWSWPMRTVPRCASAIWASRSTDAHRGTVLIGHDHIVPGRGLQQLVVVVNRHAALRTVDRTLRRVDRGGCCDARHVLHLQTEPGHLCGVHFYAFPGVLLSPARNLCDALDLG